MRQAKQLPPRQRLRKGLLLLSMLLFPITLYYFSPALILQGAAQGIISGSMIVFGLMFVSALFFGRMWCGWACPAGALQEFGAPINNRAGRRGRWIKWAIWIPWLALIAVLAIGAGGYRAVDPFFQLEGGITVAQTEPPWYLIYYIIVALFLGLALLFGRRAGCRTICWMAPFMILGRRVGNLLRLPALRLEADADGCRHCQRCTTACPMGLNVNRMVTSGTMTDDECVLCGSCLDTCPHGVIQYTFRRGK